VGIHLHLYIVLSSSSYAFDYVEFMHPFWENTETVS